VASADAERLPVVPASFDAAMVAFGIRNVGDPAAALAEVHRALKPGGRLAVLEFGTPRGLAGVAYRFYFERLLPRIGRLVSGDGSAYTYLPRSVARFPTPEGFCALLEGAGFTRVSRRALTLGIAWLYSGERSA
jgi:demethylmenaquinone methyltransferase/2-methoxy-6-polyprenyl-1,4-benzoquinol methylase